jgi:hypothetical protein
LLLHAKFYDTDAIIGSLEHTLFEETVAVEVSKTKIHIEETTAGLNIYVPKDPKDQELCYLRLLPTKLFNETMMATAGSNSTLAMNSSAVAIISSVFASSDSVIDLVLDEAGIVPVPYPDEFDKEAQEPAPQNIPRDTRPRHRSEHSIDLEDETDSVRTSSTESQQRVSTPETATASTRSASLSSVVFSTRQASYRAETSTPYSRSPLDFINRSEPDLLHAPQENARLPFTPESSREEYRRLLGNVICAARKKTGAFPSRGAFNLDELLNALPAVEASRDANAYDFPFGVRNENQLAHDMKVGAAGELYVRSPRL